MKKLTPLVILILLASLVYLQTHFDARCYDEYMSGARITPLGVYCWRNRGNGNSTEFYRLDVLEEITPVPADVLPGNVDNG